jgi:EmrB/QacA subfamily drug resistance transporter
MAVALPKMSISLHTPTLHLNAVIAAYAISLAAFLPLSAWLADRFGARTVFNAAIALFALASALCGLANSAALLIACRVFQGMSAAMMIPVGRLILLRTVASTRLLAAMVWFTVPPTLGRLAGPLVGGAIVSVATWRWIFFINIPLGALAIVLANAFVAEKSKPDSRPAPFDFAGFLLLWFGLGGCLGGLETLGKGIAPTWVSILITAAGVSLLVAYVAYGLRRDNPVIDLRILRFPTLRTNVVGVAPLRLAIFALPFLAPILFQLIFRMSPFMAGLMASGSALGSLCTRFALSRALAMFSFRRVVLGANAGVAMSFLLFSLLTASTPSIVTFAIMFCSGLLSSICLVSLNALGFGDLPPNRVSHATALFAMAQQSAAAVSVVLAAQLLTMFSQLRAGGGAPLSQADFGGAFVFLGAVSLSAMLSFSRLRSEETSDLDAQAA